MEGNGLWAVRFCERGGIQTFTVYADSADSAVLTASDSFDRVYGFRPDVAVSVLSLNVFP